MKEKIKAVASAIIAKALSLSGAPAIAVGVVVGYVGHPVIKVAVEAARLLLKI